MYDDDEDEDIEILRDGETYRVSLYMMDGTQRAIASVEHLQGEAERLTRKAIELMPKPGADPASGISLGDVLRLLKRHPACRRREAQSGSCTERENLAGDAKGKDAMGRRRGNCIHRR
jgi:hypothetical protein